MSKEEEVIIDDFFRFMRDLEKKTKHDQKKKVVKSDGKRNKRDHRDR